MQSRLVLSKNSPYLLKKTSDNIIAKDSRFLDSPNNHVLEHTWCIESGLTRVILHVLYLP